MKVLVIGSGGREHALCHAFKKSTTVEELFCIPGNAGTASIAKNFDVDIKNFEKIKEFVKQHEVDLVVIGPEQPLVDGIVDFLNENNGDLKINNWIDFKIFVKKIFVDYYEG